MDQEKSLAAARSLCKGTLMETLGIEFTRITDEIVEATMPVSPKVHQPLGLLHGGASLALAESIGSLGSHLYVRDENSTAVGLEVNANHIRSARDGMVKGIGKILHKGRKSHVWEVIIKDMDDKTLSICRMTNMIIPRN